MAEQEFKYNPGKEGLSVPIVTSQELLTPNALSDQYMLKKTTLGAFEVAGATLRGIRKSNDPNQDVFTTVQINPSELLLIVADGMGGEANGREAALTTIHEFPKIYNKFRTRRNSPSGEGLDIPDSLGLTLAEIHERIRKQAFWDGRGAAVAFTVLENQGDTFTAHTGHLGDARVYIDNGSDMIQQGKDHSVVQDLINVKTIKEEQRYTDPDRAYIRRFLGDRTLPIIRRWRRPPFITHENFDYHKTQGVKAGASVLLVSDGVWEMMPGVNTRYDVNGQKLHEVVHNASNVEQATVNIVELALEGNNRPEYGGVDNITVLMAKA